MRLRIFASARGGAGKTPEDIARRADFLRPPGARSSDPGAVGSIAQMVDFLGQYATLGTDAVYLRAADITDYDHLELIAAEVVPQLD
jgi:hypothetical protein